MARYDVFLSFRGVDTRKKFTDHLYYGLTDAGINTFRDDPELRIGEDISSALIQAIRSSRISVIVFSENYAGSRWCLQELAEIMKCRESSGQMVLPIFCGVDPPDVRYQRGSYAEAFVKHEKRLISEEGTVVLARWRRALTQAANLSGWDLKNVADGHEAKIVREIVHKISNELKHVHLSVAKYPVGLNLRVEDINKHINSGSEGVGFVGICGIGGIGKTTLAKAVYNQFFHTFEGKSFLANVRENSEQANGLLRLQEQLLCDTLKLEKIKLGSIHRGINVIKERLCSRRVLVVLDDLNHLDQLRTLAGGHEWFGSGSKIIITTRNLDLLKEVEADLYMARGLDGEESLQLFSFHAFRNNHPEDEFVELSKAITSYSNGLPLALEVLGSFLFGRTVVEWKSTLEKLKRIPNSGIQAQLRISYDALMDDTVKALFLDIACFFVGWHKDYVVKILDACGLYAEIGIVVLTERCLLEVDYERLRMHDLLRHMGREIVRVESPNYPGKRSRLWFREDVLSTLRNHQGTEEVEGITLELPAFNELILSTEAFSRMSRLRLLQLKHVDVRGDYTLVSKELRWLCWHNFPLKFIPDELFSENIIAIDFQYSKLQATWKATKILGNLKELNLSHSHFLTKTPDFSKLPSLEELILEDCRELKEIDKSLGHLDRLVLMNLKDCKKLQSIPTSICRVKSLQILEISGCSCINQLPDDFGELESLTKFLADAVPIMKLPLSIGKLRNLTHLSLSGFKTTRSSSISSLIWSWISAREAPSRNNQLITSVSELSFLKSLRLEDCHLSDGTIPESIGKLQFLELLNLKGSHFQHLPNSISCLSNLNRVVVQDCTKLKSLPDMPPSLTVLRAANCTSLERISLSNCLGAEMIDLMNCSKLESLPDMPPSLTDLRAANCTSLERISLSNCLGAEIIDLMNCSKLAEISHVGNWNSDGVLYLGGCTNLPSKCKETLLKEWRGKQLSIPGDEIPEWFEYQSRSPPLYFQIPSCHSSEMKGITVCVVCKFNHNIMTPYPLFILTNKTRNLRPTRPAPFWLVSQLLNNNHTFIFSLPVSPIMGDLDYSANKVSLDVETNGHWTVSGIGIHFECKMCPSCSTTMLSSCSNIGFRGSSLVGNEDTEVGSSRGGSSSEDYRQPKRMRYELAPETNIDEEWLLEVKYLIFSGS